MDDFVGVQVGQAAQDFPAYVGDPFLLKALSFRSCAKRTTETFFIFILEKYYIQVEYDTVKKKIKTFPRQMALRPT